MSTVPMNRRRSPQQRRRVGLRRLFATCRVVPTKWPCRSCQEVFWFVLVTVMAGIIFLGLVVSRWQKRGRDLFGMLQRFPYIENRTVHSTLMAAQVIAVTAPSSAATTDESPRLKAATGPSINGLLWDKSHPTFPDWFQAYIDFHQSAIQQLRQEQQQNTQFLIWSCPQRGQCGGLGDRLNGMVQAMYMAMCTDRILFIDDAIGSRSSSSSSSTTAVPSVLHPFLQPHQIAWHMPPHWRSRLMVPGQARTISTIDNRQNIYLLDPIHLPRNVAVIVLRANLYIGQDILEQSSCMQQYRQRFTTQRNDGMGLISFFNGNTISTLPTKESNFISESMYRMAFRAMFQWSSSVQQATRQLQQAAGLVDRSSSYHTSSSNSNTSNNNPQQSRSLPLYVAMHIRTGGAGSSWDDPNRHALPTDWIQFDACARRVQQGLMQLRSSSLSSSCRDANDAKSDQTDFVRKQIPIYIAADNVAVKQFLLDHDQQQQHSGNVINNSILHAVKDLEIFHVDRSDFKIVHNVSAAELNVYAELLLLMQAVCLVQSHSKFSILAAELSYHYTARLANDDMSIKRDRNSREINHPITSCAVFFDECDEAAVQRALASVAASVECRTSP